MPCVPPMAVELPLFSALPHPERHGATSLCQYHIMKLKGHQITNPAAGIQKQTEDGGRQCPAAIPPPLTTFAPQPDPVLWEPKLAAAIP